MLSQDTFKVMEENEVIVDDKEMARRNSYQGKKYYSNE